MFLSASVTDAPATKPAVMVRNSILVQNETNVTKGFPWLLHMQRHQLTPHQINSRREKALFWAVVKWPYVLMRNASTTTFDALFCFVESTSFWR